MANFPYQTKSPTLYAEAVAARDAHDAEISAKGAFHPDAVKAGRKLVECLKKLFADCGMGHLLQ